MRGRRRGSPIAPRRTMSEAGAAVGRGTGGGCEVGARWVRGECGVGVRWVWGWRPARATTVRDAPEDRSGQCAKLAGAMPFSGPTSTPTYRIASASASDPNPACSK